MTEWNTISRSASELAAAAESARRVARELSDRAKEAAGMDTKGGKVLLTESEGRERVAKITAALDTVGARIAELSAKLGLPEAPEMAAAAADAAPSPAKSKPSEMGGKESRPDPVDINREFGEFLGMVGRSVVNAQRELDVLSQEYLRQQGPGAPALPSLFRIPKLSADIKFALEKGNGKKLNLVLFGTHENRSEQHQQSMSFEVVSAPPPPELLRDLAVGRPKAGLVLDPPARDALLAELRVIQDPAKELELEVLSRAETWDRVLVLSVPATDPRFASPDCFLLLADPAQQHLLGVWHWRSPRLSVVYRFSLQPKKLEEIGPAHAFVVSFGGQQADFLQRLRGTE
ncbi:MAG: hypothetical protein JNL10_14520 [Verrucomicrobiales bacterium]|nr:hypothetical protein [Verrucomicrobiales bacterium]